MASSDEDDYTSDRFLAETAAAATSASLTYAQRRKQAQKQSEIKNAQNRIKSRREREAEAREQGLQQSLFERAEAEKRELGVKNKAMDMMLRMGFKPGGALGRSSITTGQETTEPGPSTTPTPPAPVHQASVSSKAATPEPAVQSEDGKLPDSQHRTVPLSVDIWAGKKGVGLGKRASSPRTLERASKSARIDEDTARETYRIQARSAFEERRAIGQLSAASRTLIALDEKAGVQFNVLSLNPQEPETFPTELLEALSLSSSSASASSDIVAQEENSNSVVSVSVDSVVSSGVQESDSERLRKQIQRDALQPLETTLLGPYGDGDDDDGNRDNRDTERPKPKKATPLPLSLSEETIDQAREFLQQDVRERLKRVLGYLREKYHYCLWCGTQYNDKEDLDGNCPGEDEEAHD
ncbi:uncharacterized protein FOMMEDRAFT_110541 [Fomitiporia mediterranea MF3/22]|uniref:uncharacterized protein n=1 Tax=Fomitiporia mediterranea (strain MF3/22) TaxID=694068 RepID=UPI0004409202|nr:uncharacterized protein FOMMEDRAFT_110541 [Fomitiporia mediterranea MF3/22]EJD01038.1 hypothetical protein FOMMEDRAFT_110541 [Fomitiporia mediterranea MF3/22]